MLSVPLSYIETLDDSVIVTVDLKLTEISAEALTISPHTVAFGIFLTEDNDGKYLQSFIFPVVVTVIPVSG